MSHHLLVAVVAAVCCILLLDATGGSNPGKRKRLDDGSDETERRQFDTEASGSTQNLNLPNLEDFLPVIAPFDIKTKEQITFIEQDLLSRDPNWEDATKAANTTAEIEAFRNEVDFFIDLFENFRNKPNQRFKFNEDIIHALNILNAIKNRNKD